MKKIIVFMLILVLSMIVFNISYADTGPKPSITVHVKNPKYENYDLDLLVYHDQAKETKKELTSLETILYNYNKDGYTAESLRNFLLFKSKEDNNTWLFTYFGTPDEFKVIIAYEDGTTDVSELIHRDAFNYEVTVNANDMHVEKNSPSDTTLEYIIPLLITIISELVISLILIKICKKNLVIILLTNILTNIFLQFYLISVHYDFLTPYFQNISLLIMFFVFELLVLLIELLIYRKLLADTSKKRITIYTIISNIVSMVLTFIYPIVYRMLV